MQEKMSYAKLKNEIGLLSQKENFIYSFSNNSALIIIVITVITIIITLDDLVGNLFAFTCFLSCFIRKRYAKYGTYLPTENFFSNISLLIQMSNKYLFFIAQKSFVESMY